MHKETGETTTTPDGVMETERKFTMTMKADTPIERKPRTATVNGRLWGSRARDWANLTERIVRPVYDTALERAGVGSGTDYLDVGCGAGMAAQLAAERGAHVSGIDAAEALLDIARERTPNGEFRQGDLEELPFADGAFEVVTGFNSFQYAGNPVVALGEAKRVCRPGGRVVIVTWGTPEKMEAASVVATLRPLLPPPPPGAPGPFALSEETALRQFTSDAGLTPDVVFDVDAPFVFPDEATALRALTATGVAARAIEVAGEAAVTEAHAKAIAPFRQPDGSYRWGAWFRCLLAHP
jgi:SAM-dependent methyltransferase